MSTLRVTQVTNRSNDGQVELTKGAILPAEQPVLDTASGLTAIEVSTATGVLTATSFTGSGIGITGLSGTAKGTAIGLIYIA